MAFLSKSASVFLLIAALFCFFSLMLLVQLSDCNYEGSSGCVSITNRSKQHQQHRKLLSSLKQQMNEMAVVKRNVVAVAVEKKDLYDWELRTAPLGPDPLHHHGDNPKKPRPTTRRP